MPGEDADPEEDDEAATGLLGSLRAQLGFGDGGTPETSAEDEAGGEPEAPAARAPDASCERDEDRGSAGRSPPVSADLARPGNQVADRPPRPTGKRAPSAPPDPSTGEADGPGPREKLASLAAPSPAPPTGGVPIPGYPGLDGGSNRTGLAGATGAGIEDVEGPEPEVLHVQVDAVLDRFAGGAGGRGAR